MNKVRNLRSYIPVGISKDGGDIAEAVLRLAEAIAAGHTWMTAEEAAEFLRYDRTTFNKLAAAGEIPRHKRGGGFRYYGPELTEWLLSS